MLRFHPPMARVCCSADVHHDAERTIVAIDRGTDTITLDVGVPIAIEERWGGGVLFKYRECR